jgi:hypothetical protein
LLSTTRTSGACASSASSADSGESFDSASSERPSFNPSGPGNSVWECSECVKRYTTRDSLSQHFDSAHKHRRDHQCDMCARKFSARGSLKRLIDTVHDKMKPYQCELCDRTSLR